MEITVKLKGKGDLLAKFKEFLYDAEESLVDGEDVEDTDQLVKSLVLELNGEDFILDGYTRD